MVYPRGRFAPRPSATSGPTGIIDQQAAGINDVSVVRGRGPDLSADEDRPAYRSPGRLGPADLSWPQWQGARELVDSDGDQMTDGWEVKYGLSPTDNRDALSDLDGDTYTNLEEFRANTDPSDEKDKPTGSTDSDPTIWIILGIGLVIIIVIVAIVLIFVIRKKMSKEINKVETEEKPEEETSPTWSGRTPT